MKMLQVGFSAIGHSDFSHDFYRELSFADERFPRALDFEGAEFCQWTDELRLAGFTVEHEIEDGIIDQMYVSCVLNDYESCVSEFSKVIANCTLTVAEMSEIQHTKWMNNDEMRAKLRVMFRLDDPG